jgi:hypothetical protein
MLNDAHQHLPSTYNGMYRISVWFPTQIKCCTVSVDKITILIKNWSGVLVNVRKNWSGVLVNVRKNRSGVLVNVRKKTGEGYW